MIGELAHAKDNLKGAIVKKPAVKTAAAA